MPPHHNLEIMSRKAAKKSTSNGHGGKRKKAGRPSAGRVRVVAYVLPATADAIDAIELEQGCKPGVALDILLGITPPAESTESSPVQGPSER